MNGIINIRDTWIKVKGYGADWGIEATMTIKDFAEIWTLIAVYIPKP